MTTKLWSDFTTWQEVQTFFNGLGQDIREGRLEIGRPVYALCLAHGVVQAIHSGIGRISCVEFGVAQGAGLLDLCKAAEWFRANLGMEIDVYGVDGTVGLPEPQGYRDHPEIWGRGQYAMVDRAGLLERLPPYCELLVGDVAEVAPRLAEKLDAAPLGMAALDLDYHSSTVKALRLLTGKPECYVPAVPLYVDDMAVLVTFNRACGAALAIEEFNQQNPLRRIEDRWIFAVHNLHFCHVLDHPIRTGAVAPKIPFEIRVF